MNQNQRIRKHVVELYIIYIVMLTMGFGLGVFAANLYSLFGQVQTVSKFKGKMTDREERCVRKKMTEMKASSAESIQDGRWVVGDRVFVCTR